MVDFSFYNLKVNTLDDCWEILINKSDLPVSHQVRDLRILKLIIENDSIILRKLEEGKEVRKQLKFEKEEGITANYFTEMLRPLLIESHVVDSLYQYQRDGVAWLLKHNRAILADDMGLGKTLQAISAARRLIRLGRIKWVLVVSPRTLVSNWLSEISKWAPELKVTALTVSSKNKNADWLKNIGRSHFIITTYEYLRGDITRLIENPPDLIIADEAHRLRKRESQTSQSFRGVNSKYLWALTGTPIERSSEDLMVLMSLIEHMRFAQKDNSLHQSSLQARARPYVLRRKKSEVLSEIPNVIEIVETIDLTEKQRKSYNETLRGVGYSNHLAKFNKLREICDYDPASHESSKIERIIELIYDILENNEKVIVFSYTIEPLLQLNNDLKNLSINTSLLIGENSIDERNNAIENFKTLKNINVLLASTKIASEGLNLTEANNVVFLNRWWNPSANIQARDRVVRIGQTRVVNVFAFKCRNTVEESLEKILSQKKITFEEVMSAMTKIGVEYLN